jgi:hypothetical protein
MPDIAAAKSALASAQALMQKAIAALTDTVSPVIRVNAGQSLQAAIDAAPAHATLQLEDATYDGAIMISKPLSFIGFNPPPTRRATRTSVSAWITSRDPQQTIFIDSPELVQFTGIGVKTTSQDATLINHVGAGLVLDRVVALGDPAVGAHRGLLLNGATVQVRQCYVDDIFVFGRDSCALGGTDGSRDIVVDDCALYGAGMSVLFGGADSSSVERMPTNVRITHSLLSKNPAWYTMRGPTGATINIKNAYELKVGINCYLADSILEYAGISEGQSAYLILLNVRNQNGKAPWTAIKNFKTERILGRHAGGCINFLGADDRPGFPSDVLDGATIKNAKFTDIDPTSGPWKGAGRGFFFANAPRHVTLDGITVEGTLGALGYFDVPAKRPLGLTLQNIKSSPTTYGWKIEDGPLDQPPAAKNLKAYMAKADGTSELTYNVTANDVGAVGYPIG